MKRLVLSLITVACISGAYLLYARTISPYTVPVPTPPVLAIESGEPVQPPKMVNTADTYLSDVDWAVNAKYKVQHGERGFLYFDRQESQDESVDFTPFALVWTDPSHPEAAPYVFHCETARLNFEKPFRVGGSSPGRILGASLFGKVRITGPNGLVIDGEDFKFSEESHQLYSDSAIRFRYQPEGESVQQVVGQADQLQVDLIPANSSPYGDDMPRIGGVESVRLRRNVAMDFSYLDQQTPRTARITSRGPFTYEIARQLASFNETVHVQRPTHQPSAPPAFDTLFCEVLALQFETVPHLVPGPMGEMIPSTTPPDRNTKDGWSLANGPMRFRRLRAVGDQQHPVVMTSQVADLTARMLDLGYDAIERRVVLLDDKQGALLRRGPAVLRSPEMRLQHTEAGQLVSAQCLGAGRFDYTKPVKALASTAQAPVSVGTAGAGTADVRAQDDVILQCEWKSQLWFEPQPDGKQTVISLAGEAQVIQPGESGILSDRLTLWLNAIAPSLKDVSGSTNRLPTDELPLQRVLAEGHVAMAGKAFRAETSRLDVQFRPGSPPALLPGQGLTPFGDSSTTSGSTAELRAVPEEIWHLGAQALEVVMIQDPVTREMGVADAVGLGDVLIRQVSDAKLSPSGRDNTGRAAGAVDEGLSLRGKRIHFENGGGSHQLLTMTGEIAEMKRGDVRIEGGKITFNRAANTARVDGKGTLRLPVETGLTGEKLDQPTSLDIHWKRELIFDGIEARFIEAVVTRMQESVMRCDEMVVNLQRRIDFAADPKQQPEVAIHQIIGKNRVDLEFYNWEGSELTQITRAQAAEFRARHDSGAFEVRGPGRVEDWQLGKQRRVSVAPSAVAQANQPAVAGGREWAYTSLEFAGAITGNFRKRQATLKDRVRVIYAPVDQAWRKFVRDDLTPNSDSASNAVWLGCDELEVALQPWGKGERDFVQLLAKGKTQRVELEGRLFQANADTLSYNESSELFTLRGLGTNRAHVSYQEKLGTRYKDTTAQTIQFIPSRRYLHVEESGGISGGG